MRRFDALTERRMGETIARRASGPPAREVVVESAFGLLFVTAALLLAVLAPTHRDFSAPLAVGFVVALAVAVRVEFASGAGFALPTQLVFVPMLLLLPTPIVPLLVAAAMVLVGLTRRGRSPATIPLWFADAWWAVGPAAVLCALGAETPAWG